MIIINNSGHLKYENLKFRCALGKAGIKKKIKEGDNVTPKGNYKIVQAYYRADRIKKLSSCLKFTKIKKNMGWCDDYKEAALNGSTWVRVGSKIFSNLS